VKRTAHNSAASRWYHRNKEKARAIQRATYHKAQARLAAHKLKEGCSVCGYNKCSLALHYHHIHGKAVSDETILVCSNCHYEIHEKGAESDD